VNAVTALVFCALLGTSILLEWVLPAGHGHDIEWLGHARHFWGEVHFWLGVGLLGLIVTHVVLHARWVASCWRRSIGTVRSPLSWLPLGVGVTLILLPVFVPHQHLGAERRPEWHGEQASERAEPDHPRWHGRCGPGRCLHPLFD
jgi:hypothetical protein